MYVLYNIHEIVLLIKIMRKLYQILYNVGRLTDAPERRAFPFWGTLGQWAFPFWGTLGQWAFPFWGTLGQWAFPFWGTLGQWAGLRGGKHSELRSPFFPLALPLSGHVAVLRCSMEECIDKCLYASVLAVHGCADGMHRTEGGLRSRPVPGGCRITGVNLH